LAPAKITFEPDFDKIGVAPSFTDKMKVLLINPSFENNLRHNIFECFNKLQKIEGDKDQIKQDFENNYRENFLVAYLEGLKAKYNKEILEFSLEHLNNNN
jgi:hypothetical protein